MLRRAGSPSDRRLLHDVLADHDALVAARDRYDSRPPSRLSGRALLLRDLVTHVGFQQLAAFRCAAALHRRGLTPVAMVVCRFIRFVYGAEMHWATDIGPGVVLVHGNGLVIGRDVRIATGCVLFQHVTLGMSRSADGVDGSPTLLEQVHVGPGAVVLGPVTVGEHSKIGPNAVVTASVAARTTVVVPEAVAQPREPSNPSVER